MPDSSSISKSGRTSWFEVLEGRLFLSASPVPVFAQTNLVSDGSVAALHTDTQLVNAWGLGLNKFGQFWVGDNGTGLSTVYDTAGVLGSPVVAIPPSVGGSAGTAVTGVVTNSAGKAFNITANGITAPAAYLFVSEGGTISGWNPAVDLSNAVNAVDNSATGAVYKGVAIAGKGKKALAFAANFHAGTIDVFNSQFQPVTPVGGFVDANIPTGFAPFNVQTIGNKLYVTYALQDSAAHDDVAGAGNGFVDVFDTKGRLKQRLASQAALNSPWAVVQGVGHYKNDILVGNFGDGTINVFNKKGVDIGAAVDANNQPIVIDGLWGLAYGAHHDKNNLFFAAGPNGEANGLFGKLSLTKIAASAISASGAAGGGTTSPVYP